MQKQNKLIIYLKNDLKEYKEQLKYSIEFSILDEEEVDYRIMLEAKIDYIKKLIKEIPTLIGREKEKV